uniref:Ribosomal protein small subunit 3 n=1 Tax=Paramoeba pemaquidensis TaxID=180228 RepID=A0A1D8DA58_9EUKA|nr:ribosomal protein small subunit 3 [Paramoeba pemaquidensis]AOS85530.1 ribosomal protein small subunit 3 [Paramoeba pemaquidensis]
MRSQNLSNKLEILKFDSVSKLNIYNSYKNLNLFSIKNLKFLVMLDSSDKFFYKKILVLSDIAANWFNQKLHVYKIKNKKNQRKNNIFYQFGCTLNNINKINNIMNYINSVMKFIAIRIDNNLNLMLYKKYCIYTFNNLNYLLGLNSSKYFSIKMDYNLIIIYNINNQIINNSKLRAFYEKIFFL